jgi:hypothetical protein
VGLCRHPWLCPDAELVGIVQDLFEDVLLALERDDEDSYRAVTPAIDETR